MSATPTPRLITLDIDGTIVREDGTISSAVRDAVGAVDEAGHHVVLATGRSASTTLPILEQLGLRSPFVVCANGAVTLRRDTSAPLGYRRDRVEVFDPTEVLRTLRTHLPNARFAVEDEAGHYRHTEPFPDATIGRGSEQVVFDSLLHRAAARLVVMSPGHDMDDFLDVVERMGLRRVTYAVGWTAWLDISADGVSKASATERVRIELAVPSDRITAVADGHNDVELLRWAAATGRGVAMGHAPDAVRAAGNSVTASVADDGLAAVLVDLLDRDLRE